MTKQIKQDNNIHTRVFFICVLFCVLVGWDDIIMKKKRRRLGNSRQPGRGAHFMLIKKFKSIVVPRHLRAIRIFKYHELSLEYHTCYWYSAYVEHILYFYNKNTDWRCGHPGILEFFRSFVSSQRWIGGTRCTLHLFFPLKSILYVHSSVGRLNARGGPQRRHDRDSFIQQEPCY